MSSEIFYDKAFIRVEEKYIPVVNHGSSNCFEFDSRGREIPEKTWSVLSHPYTERMLFTADEIREIADFYEEISMSNRGGTKKSRNRSFEENEFRRWILAGMKSAHTVEEYMEFGNRVIIIDYSEDRWMKYSVPTTEALLDKIQELADRQITVGFWDNRHVNRPTMRRSERQPFDFSSLPEYYVLLGKQGYNSQYCSKKAVKSEQLESMVHTLIQNQMALYLDAKSIIAELNKKNTSQVRYKVYKEQINNLQRQIDRYMELKAALYEDYAEGTITAEDYVAMGQEYAQKADELRIFLSEIKKESRKYDPEYLGGEHWAKLVADFKDQKTLDRKMVEAFVNKLTLYNDGRAEIEFNFRDELEEVLLWAAMRKKEVNKYAG